MNITVLRAKEEETIKQVPLAKLEFIRYPESPGILGIPECDIQVPGDGVLAIWASYAEENHNMSFFVKHDGEHVFTGMCNWDQVAPYFAYRTKAGHMIEFFFAK